ncbi:uncharacterized protein A1O9_09718 [Exophiala aquamarina CBS 119918]|uniref:Uncharacterized protein n=1 Tax=Exophiala aquamarina CBS 119918 TaxID=1182545 RepID=A0A072P3R6_9EURO|nr:uncharacterized protein A1O9_09718 [Exophiala aquamarina CBS 119918]KEF53923.1 hypothetical protein A1O9_09718 [Exophiala aquamarina CBS 119918]
MDWREKRALKFFMQRTAPELEGSFLSQLWYEFFQLATDGRNPIRPAVVAVASMHEQYVTSGSADLPLLDYSMEQYNKAIREVTQLNAAKQEHAFDLALAACVLFSCLEGLRGHYQSLISHILSGMNIMSHKVVSMDTTRLTTLSRVLLHQVLMRVNAQVMAMGDNCMLSNTCTVHLTVIPDAFTSANEAMFALEQLYCALMHFYTNADEAFKSQRPSAERAGKLWWQREAFKDHHKQWKRSSTHILHYGPPSSLSSLSQMPPEALILTITSISISISLDIDIRNFEIDFDRFEDQFREIVMAAEVFLDKTSPGTGDKSSLDTKNFWTEYFSDESHIPRSESSGDSPDSTTGSGRKHKPELMPSFSMRFGVVPHLYWAAARCRSPRIKRRAVLLLLLCNRREGLWDSKICGRVAERVITIEETAALAHKEPAGFDGDKCVLISASDVPGDSRVTVLQSKFEAGNKIRISYSDIEGAGETVEILEL